MSSRCFSIQKILCHDCLRYYSPQAGDDPFPLYVCLGKTLRWEREDSEGGDICFSPNSSN